MIQVEALSKYYEKKTPGLRIRQAEKIKAIDGVNFLAKDGEITALLGANGAGKSTTLRIISTLIKPTSGLAIVDGIDVVKEPLLARKQIGFLPHNSGLYPRLSAIENIRYYAKIAGLEASEIEVRIGELIKLLDMQSIADRRAEGYSQGQRTKVALARALIHRPKTLMLDEPTNGLDIMATRNLREILKRLRDEGHCVLLSSHIMQEVAALCDHVAIINEGKITIEGSVTDIKNTTGQDDLEDAFVAAIGETVEVKI